MGHSGDGLALCALHRASDLGNISTCPRGCSWRGMGNGSLDRCTFPNRRVCSGPGGGARCVWTQDRAFACSDYRLRDVLDVALGTDRPNLGHAVDGVPGRLGRHVDRFKFLDVMLGDQPPLTPPELAYQRMLAGDSDEAAEQAEEFLQDGLLLTYYEKVLVEVETGTGGH